MVAVGNPFGLGGTVTAGIVSARGRDIGAGPYDDYVQIDAPINKGNSGGPAFDINGNVIGVNTAIYSPSGGSVGIGFDIPAGTAKLVVAQLKDKGYITRGWLGVQVQPVTADIADSLGLKQARGAMVDNPQAGSPAAKAGIEAGDVITSVNGTDVKDSRDLARTISMMAPGSSGEARCPAQGRIKPITLTLGEMPNDHQASTGEPQSKRNRGHAPSRPQPRARGRGGGRRPKGCRGDVRRSGGTRRRARLQDRGRYPQCRRQDGRKRRRCSFGADASQATAASTAFDSGENSGCDPIRRGAAGEGLIRAATRLEQSGVDGRKAGPRARPFSAPCRQGALAPRAKPPIGRNRSREPLA